MPPESRPTGQSTSRQRDVARRKAELLAEAGQEPPKGVGGDGSGGQGMQFAGAVAVSVGLGYWLDRTFGTSPWLVMAGVILGVTVGFIALVRAAKDNEARASSSAKRT